MISYIRNIYYRVKEVIIDPSQFWKGQNEASRDFLQIAAGYLLPLIILTALCIFTGELIRGSRFYLFFPAMKAIRKIILYVLYYVIAVFFANELMPVFGSPKNLPVARSLVAFSLTPSMLISIITGLFPFLYVLNILGVYGFYIFSSGVKELLQFDEKMELRYIVSVILVNIIVFIVLSILLSKALTAIL